MSNSHLQFWPFNYEPRDVQSQCFDWLSKQTTKYCIIDAPVGSGKSNIAIWYSKFLKAQSFILTPQRILQKQYVDSMESIESISISALYGKANYTCSTSNTSCEIGGLLKTKCPSCPHSIAKRRAQTATNAVLNYDVALTSFAYTDLFSQRDLMVIDECHALEDSLVAFDALMITKARCTKYNLPYYGDVNSHIIDVFKWIRDIYRTKLTSVVNSLESQYESLKDKNSKNLLRHEITFLQEYEALYEHYEGVMLLTTSTEKYIETNFVLVPTTSSLTFKRLTGEHTFNKVLLPKAKRFLFMSSTVLSKEGFCRDLGLDPNDVSYISLNSEFPIENRPVIYMPQMKMTFEWNQPVNLTSRKNMIDSIIKVLELHKNESGIIHTGNYAISEWLVEQLEDKTDFVIYHHNPSSKKKRDEVIGNFIKSRSKSKILISPSITEGLDLKEDLGRFAIFVKVPYGNLADKWIKRRMEMSNEWYSRRAIVDIIQGGGRIVRTPSDKGTVYILDGSFGHLYKITKDIIPQWWKDAFHIL